MRSLRPKRSTLDKQEKEERARVAIRLLAYLSWMAAIFSVFCFTGHTYLAWGTIAVGAGVIARSFCKHFG
jgi:hypothetical protein